MALSTSVHDLRTLIRSCQPLIVIETVEKERVLALLQSVAAQERIPLFEWSATKGRLQRLGNRTGSSRGLLSRAPPKTPLTTDLLIEELTNTVPLSVTRHENIDQLREAAQGRFVNVR